MRNSLILAVATLGLSVSARKTYPEGYQEEITSFLSVAATAAAAASIESIGLHATGAPGSAYAALKSFARAAATRRVINTEPAAQAAYLSTYLSLFSAQPTEVIAYQESMAREYSRIEAKYSMTYLSSPYPTPEATLSSASTSGTTTAAAAAKTGGAVVNFAVGGGAVGVVAFGAVVALL